MSKQKIYTREFKESSVSLAIESKQPIAYTARDLGINVNTLYTWIDKHSRALKKTLKLLIIRIFMMI